MTCGTWIGFDNRQTLGSGEQGARAALPMWMDFMKVAIQGKPDEKFPSGDMPKKQLAVAVDSGKGDASKPKSDDDAPDNPDNPRDPDDPDGSGVKVLPTPKAAPATTPAPAPAIPVAPPAPAPRAPVSAAPAKVVEPPQ